MKIDPNSITPELWMAEDASGCTFALVCGRRFAYTPAPIGTKADPPEGTDPKSHRIADVICHPVMIEIMPCPCVIHFGKTLADRHWTRVKPEYAGLSIRTAQLALAEAYRGLEYARINLQTMTLECRSNVDKFIAYKGGTPWRNVNICLQWDRWEKAAVPAYERERQLLAMGFKCDGTALERYAGEKGI